MQERSMTDPAFCSALRDTLRLGKYTHQFADLTSDEIAGLLWLLGEYVVRAERIFPRVDEVSPGDRRRIAAHNALVATRTQACVPILSQAKQLMRESVE